MWIIVNTLIGSFKGLFETVQKSRFDEFDTVGDHVTVVSDVKKWPLSARIMRSLFGDSKNREGDQQDLMLNLIKAGLPFVSPAHYYGSQAIYSLMFGVGILVILLIMSSIFNIPLLFIFVLSLVGGYFGAIQPDAEVKSGIKRRREEMVLDLTNQLQRFITALESTGNAIEALRDVAQTAHDPVVDEETRKKAATESEALSKEYQSLLAMTLQGMGGNLFAEIINRIAVLVGQGRPISEAVGDVRVLYPEAIEMDSFFNILISAEKGVALKERLEDLSDQLYVDLDSTSRERAAKAEQMVTVAGFVALLPLFVIIGAPMITMAFQLFR